MITIYTYNGQVLTEASTGEWLIEKAAQPVIPANTIRVRTSDGQPPIKDAYTLYETATLVPGTSDIYDVYLSGTSFRRVLYNSTNVVEIIAANTTNINNMSYAFYNTALTTVPIFDTSSVTDMSSMFSNCSSLVSVPLFNTTNVTNMSSMFSNCYNVESGALALYQQASTQAKPPTRHRSTFRYCGRDTTTGAAELAQIPSSWK